MTSWADANARAAAAASELHADLRIDLTKPVDVFDAIKRAGPILAFSSLGNVAGIYLPQASDQSSPGILIHSGHPRTRQRYTAGHELGHYVFKHARHVDLDPEAALRRTGVVQWSDEEMEAEAFGAWFLMPRRLIRRGLQALKIALPTTPGDVYALSLWLGTSYTATARQLAATKIVTRDESDKWARIEPRTIKRELAGEMVPNDLRNDVWWLDARRDGEVVDARTGDRLVISLDEIPSSGFSWRFAEQPEGMRVVGDSYRDDWLHPVSSAEERDHEELAGGSYPRSLVLEVEGAPQREVQRILLVKDQIWEPDSAVDQFELSLSVNPSLKGIQMLESDLALTR